MNHSFERFFRFFLAALLVLSAMTASLPLHPAQPVQAASPLDADDALVAHYRFDEGEGNTARDSTGLNPDGIFTGGAVWSGNSRVGPGAVNVYNDGSSVQIQNPAFIDAINEAGKFSISLWVRPDDLPSFSTMLTTENSELALGMDQNDKIRFQINGKIVYAGTNYVPGQWHHVVATYDGETGEAAIYVNGARDGSLNVGAGVQLNYKDKVVIGNNWWVNKPRHFHEIDDVRVYSKVLSESEIAALYQMDQSNVETFKITFRVSDHEGPLEGAEINVMFRAWWKLA